MNDYTPMIDLTLTFDEGVVGDLAVCLGRFDPTMAVAVAPYITVVYPEEYTDLELLMTRARTTAADTSPFSLSATGVVIDGEGQNEIFTDLVDPTDSWNELRRQLLTLRFGPIDARPRLTIADPRTPNSDLLRGPKFAPNHCVATSSPTDWPCPPQLRPTNARLWNA